MSAEARVIITIDGPAGTGKSTVAHRLAKALGLEFLDTGAMYRAAALVAIEGDLDLGDGPALASAVRAARVRFLWRKDPPRILIGERDVTSRIRELDVSGVVSIVAAHPEVRKVLVRRQREIADEHPRLVTEGRDQGSVVFPDAPLRFYLDADVEVRAERRLLQLERAGQAADLEIVVKDIRERDRIDSSRADAPLVCPDGAVVIDTSCISLDEVIDRMEHESRARLVDVGFRA